MKSQPDRREKPCSPDGSMDCHEEKGRRSSVDDGCFLPVPRPRVPIELDRHGFRDPAYGAVAHGELQPAAVFAAEGISLRPVTGISGSKSSGRRNGDTDVRWDGTGA